MSSFLVIKMYALKIIVLKNGFHKYKIYVRLDLVFYYNWTILQTTLID